MHRPLRPAVEPRPSNADSSPTAPQTTDAPSPPEASPPEALPSEASRDRPWLHLLLFALALVSTIWAGGDWASRLLYYNGEAAWLAFADTHQNHGAWVYLFNTGFLFDGLRYAVALLGFLTVHEFGHYFTARYHRIDTSLPYYIPFPFNGIGNFGAVIRIREAIPSMRSLFDIGVSGPLAGFVVALGALLYAFATLPGPEYLLDQPGHEALKAYIRQHGTFPSTHPEPEPGTLVIVVGQTPLYWMLSQFFPHVPPMYEMYHYPVLFAGWLGLFFTALNLLPVGQLDGGHVLYALFGRAWHRRLARGFVMILLLSGGIGFIEWIQEMDLGATTNALAWPALAGILYGYMRRTFGSNRSAALLALAALLTGVGIADAVGPPLTGYGYLGWLIWTLLIVFLVRVEHPPVLNEDPLTPRRRLLGYAAIVIFLLCFSLQPLSVMS